MRENYIMNFVKFTASYEVTEVEKFEVSSPEDVKTLLNDLFDIGFLHTEHFVMIGLDSRNVVTCVHTVHIGGLMASIVDIRASFFAAIHNNCASVIFAHNHPSQSNAIPSNADITTSKKLSLSGSILGIEVLDSVIVSGNDYYSMATEGHLEVSEDITEIIENL
ncbi:JAB domain-containing protein [Mammaliicoccus sciuri]|uniref:JAB domain-containing protein n=2 Tax=Mammaliicoccus TaxID=2803850 RepID=UPI002737CCCB|nr:JAB domain-containing protein [Mammaliicoccus sciuri]